LADLNYPGWKAYVDGTQKDILNANYLFRGVFINEGNHVIKFIYDPLSFKLGWVASFISLVVLICIGIRLRKKRKIIL
jgi:uncharacterized membrane protein YfhO